MKNLEKRIYKKQLEKRLIRILGVHPPYDDISIEDDVFISLITIEHQSRVILTTLSNKTIPKLKRLLKEYIELTK